jgi:hypothetical protein
VNNQIRSEIGDREVVYLFPRQGSLFGISPHSKEILSSGDGLATIASDIQAANAYFFLNEVV